MFSVSCRVSTQTSLVESGEIGRESTIPDSDERTGCALLTLTQVLLIFFSQYFGALWLHGSKWPCRLAFRKRGQAGEPAG